MQAELAAGIIIGKLMHLGGMLQRQGNKMLRPFDLNHQQFSIFFEIAMAGKVKQKEVVNRLVLEKAHVSKVVKKLQQMGLIAISESQEDRRSAWLSVTPKGMRTLEKCRAMFKAWNTDWVSQIDPQDLPGILESLTTLQDVIKQQAAQHA